MLGTRGVRLGVLHPGDLRDAGARDRRAPRGPLRERTGEAPQLEIMIPLVAYEKELELMRELVERVVDGGGAAGTSTCSIGTMIELPRACFVADRIAAARRLLLVRHQRPHPDRARLLARRRGGPASSTSYIETKIVDRSPFETIDRPGVGWLVRLAAWVGPRGQART